MQVILLSATMPTDVLEVTKRFMRDPIRILVKKEELTLEGIKQFYVQVEKEVGACVHCCVCVFDVMWCAGVETWHSVWPLQDTHHNTGSNICEHKTKSWLANRANALSWFHRLCNGKQNEVQ